MRKKYISIIIPVYNIEQYLPSCLDSIINQTYYNLEIILVDDGSPDNSGKICDEYATIDSRIRVFHIPNGGVAKARQLGVEKSTGEYIIFADADDWMELNAVENLYNAIAPDIDIVRSSFNYFCENDNSFSPKILEDKIYLKDNYITGILTRIFVHAPWGNLYRKRLFTSESFPVFTTLEDLLMNVNLACKCHKVSAISKITYNYRYDSLTSSKLYSHKSGYEISYNLCKYIYDSLKRYDCYESSKETYAIKAIYILYSRILETNNDVYKDPLIHEIVNVLEDSKPNLKIKLKIITIKHPSLRGVMRALHSVKAKFFN